ncbi:MAG TPA: hypothetical protein VJ953_10990 [Saprospiraceae bacterium]|nr:hypothetical protein [Saprospiraceae bacterium]
MSFEEEQRFNQWWLWLILIGLNLIPAFGIYQQVFKGQAFGNHPLSDTGLIVLQAFLLLFLWTFWRLRLKTAINEEFITFTFYPFANKTIPWTEVRSATLINYGFVGGWGVRLSSKYGTVYNTSGQMGLLLELDGGKKICIGTQKPEELGRLIEKRKEF